jgi:hypothetical protein
VVGEAFVVAGAAAVAGDPARVRSTTQRRGRTAKVCKSSGRLTISTVSFSQVAAQGSSLLASRLHWSAWVLRAMVYFNQKLCLLVL